MSKATRYSPEVRERAVRMVLKHERVKALEKEVKELRRANEILKTASAFFAAAE
jgi:transposase